MFAVTNKISIQSIKIHRSLTSDTVNRCIAPDFYQEKVLVMVHKGEAYVTSTFL